MKGCSSGFSFAITTANHAVPMSETYSAKSVTIDAAFPRQAGSTITNDRLKLNYRKYTRNPTDIANADVVVNLVFVHGTGMNKGVWYYLIDKLYKNTSFVLGNTYAVDMVNSGDSAALNHKNLSYCYDWIDGAFDIVELIKHENKFVVPGKKSINIMIGHSMGGFISAYTQYIYPGFFQAVVPLNPVIFTDTELFPIFTSVFNGWIKKGFMRDNFDSIQDLETHFKTKSFFKRFHPQVLRDFLEVDVYKSGERNDLDKDRSYTKSTEEFQVITYFTSFDSLPQGMKHYKDIKVPVYYICSNQDSAMPQAIEFFTNQIPKDLLHSIECEGTHCVHAENPDLITGILADIISERVKLDSSNVAVGIATLSRDELTSYRAVAKEQFVQRYGAKI